MNFVTDLLKGIQIILSSLWLCESNSIVLILFSYINITIRGIMYGNMYVRIYYFNLTFALICSPNQL